MAKKAISAQIDEELKEKIDSARGDLSLNKFITQALEDAVAEELEGPPDEDRKFCLKAKQAHPAHVLGDRPSEDDYLSHLREEATAAIAERSIPQNDGHVPITQNWEEHVRLEREHQARQEPSLASRPMEAGYDPEVHDEPQTTGSLASHPDGVPTES